MKTIAQQLGVTDFPFDIRDKRGNLIYHERDRHFWQISGLDAKTFWARWEYDEKGNQIYFENSYGKIIDNRPKELAKEIAEEQTISQQLGINQFPFEITDDRGRLLYMEWWKSWSRWEHNEKGWLIYYKNSDNFWERWKHDENGKEIYYENSRGEIRGNRPNEKTNPELDPKPTPMIIEFNGKKYKLIEI
jgi:hypothetical protein